jgi:S1-C subfamily serine protease
MGSRSTVACAFVCVILGLAGCAPGSPGIASAQLPPSQIFEAVKPAVVLVEAAESVSWSVPEPSLDPSKKGQLHDRLTAMVRAGTVAPNEDALKRATAQLITDDPGSWFSLAAGRYRRSDTVYLVGSGFFVTEDGYLLTNAHVVQASQEDVKRLLVGGVTQGTAEEAFVQSVRDGLAQGLQTPVSDQQAQKLARWLSGVYVSDVQVESVTPTYRIAFGSHSPKDIENQGLPVRVVAQGEPVPGKDVAVLKADGGAHVSLPLASQPPSQGAGLEVVGYPCGCQAAEEVGPDKTLVPTLTQGSVQGELPMPSGWWATGTDAQMEHGNSGGPALDRSGRVVGLATFRGGGTQTYNFVLPIAVTSEFTRQAHVRPVQGQLGQQYTEAVSEFSKQHYRAALPMFRQVAKADAHNPYVADYVERSRLAISAGRDRTPPPTPEYLRWLLAYWPYLLVAFWALGGLVVAIVFAPRLLRRPRGN